MAAVLDETSHSGERVLLAAVACSLALHLALLYLLPALFESTKKAAPEPKALTARLVPPKPEAPRVVEQPAPTPPQPAPKAVRPAPQKPVPRAEPVAPPVIAIAPAPASPPAVAVAAPQLPAVTSASVVPTVPRKRGPDPLSIGLFQQQLLEIAKLHKRYPRVAIDNNWEGKVMFRMVIAANGTIASLSVRKSSGYAALDDEGQRMLRDAKNELPIPPELRGWEFTLDVGAEFYLLK